MKKILLPTDFSENSLNAIYYALQLFKNKSCRFYLLHTYTPASYYSGKVLNSFSSLEFQDLIRHNAEENMRNLMQKILGESKNRKHHFESKVSFNLLVSEIKDIIKEKKIQMIIMGTQGATGAKKIFLGTHTMFTIKKVMLPILAVPSGYTFKVPEEVLFATDYKNITENKLKLIKEFCDLNKARLHVLNVFHGEIKEEEQMENKKFISKYFGNSHPVLHTIEGKDVPDTVEKFQKEYEIDLLIMIHNKHSFFENILFKPVINQLIYHTNIPFLVIPSGIEKME